VLVSYTKQNVSKIDIQKLLVWEQLWYGVFKGVRDGVDSEETIMLKYPKLAPPAREWTVTTAVERRAREIYERSFLETGGLERVTMKPIPAEPRVWQRLKEATTPEGVREACRVSRYWLRPNREGRAFLRLLPEHAQLFVDSKKNSRYPASERPTSEDKRLDHFARAMAGITLRKSPVTAIDQMRKWKHPQNCPCWRCLVK
jgi:hypothetical protein